MLMNATARSFVRQDWFGEIVRECQMFAGRTTVAPDIDALRDLMSELTTGLPNPRTPAEDLALRGVLTTTAAKWAGTAHAAFHPNTDAMCAFVPATALDQLWDVRGDGAKQAASRWADAYWMELQDAHAPSAVRRALDIIQRDCRMYSDYGQLAAAVGARPTKLRRAFEAEIGVSIAEYVRRVRVMNAIEQLVRTDTKIASVASSVGYDSKTNFYRAFRRIVGMTPSAFQRLPETAARDLAVRLRDSMPHARRHA